MTYPGEAIDRVKKILARHANRPDDHVHGFRIGLIRRVMERMQRLEDFNLEKLRQWGWKDVDR